MLCGTSYRKLFKIGLNSSLLQATQVRWRRSPDFLGLSLSTVAKVTCLNLVFETRSGLDDPAGEISGELNIFH